MQIPMPYDSIVDGLREDNQESQREFLKRFGSRIEAWARKRLPPAYQIHLDPGELASTVCRTVMDHCRFDEGYSMPVEDEAKKFLYTILIRKISGRLQKAFAQIRDIRRNTHVSALEAEGQVFDFKAVDDVYDRELEELLDLARGVLGEDERTILRMLLEGCPKEAIAAAIGISTVRGVNYRIARMEKKLMHALNHV